MVIEIFSGDKNEIQYVIDRWASECNGEAMGIDTQASAVVNEMVEMIRDPESTVIVAKDNDTVVGIIGVVRFISPTGRQRIASEHYWYVLPEYRGSTGIRLLDAARMWAKGNHCSHFILTASRLSSDMHDRICGLCEKMGMEKFETSFIERIR